MHPGLAVLLGLITVLVLGRRRLPLGLAFLTGALVVAVAVGWGAVRTGTAVLDLSVLPGTWIFIGQVGLVFLLSLIMSRAGSLDTLLAGAATFIPNRRLRFASLPALVGLLPMPGGAIVSAPLVERTRSAAVLDGCDKNLINYWYRHVWEVCWPLYPPLLLAATFLPDRDMVRLCLSQLPLMGVLLLVGWIFILRRIPAGADHAELGTGPSGFDLFSALLPLLVVVASMPLGKHLVGGFVAPEMEGSLGLIVAICAGLLAALLQGGGHHFWPAMKDRRVWALVLLAFGVKVFGGMVAETGAAKAIAGSFRDGGVPTLLSVAALPFLVGVVSGATIAVVSVAFPVVVALLGPTEPRLPALVLAYAAGFAGYMLSPVHMCLVLSSRFFGQSLTRAYRPLVWPLTLFLVGASALHFLLQQGIQWTS